jgi:EmrB/QacA subfamily drug resistance transporter
MSTTSTPVVEPPDVGADVPENPNHARRWSVLTVLAVAQLMVVLDATIVNIALPSAQKSLHFGTSDRQWVVTAYALAFGGLLLLGGRLSDMFGRKRMLLIGLIGFGAASAVGGAATGFTMLIGARAAQGGFGALLAPAALSLLTTTFTEPKERGTAFAIYGAIAGAGGGIGLLLGGMLTEWLDWRWCLYVNVAFAAVGVIGGAILIRNPAVPAIKSRLDIPGLLTSIGGVVGVVYGFAHAESGGWLNTVTLAAIAAGVILLAAFVVIERRVDHPLLPLRVIADRNRGGSYLAMFIAPMGIFGMFLFLTYYLQASLGYSPIKTGLAFMPMVVALSISSTVASAKLLGRIGPKPLVSSGMLIGAGGLAWLTQITLTSSYLTGILPGLVLFGLGIGLVIAPSMATATLGVRKEDSGLASALVSSMQQIGGSVGTAVLSTLAASAITTDLHHKAHTAANIAHATLHSYTTAFTWGAVALIIGAVACGLLLRNGVNTPDPDTEPVLIG